MKQIHLQPTAEQKRTIYGLEKHKVISGLSKGKTKLFSDQIMLAIPKYEVRNLYVDLTENFKLSDIKKVRNFIRAFQSA